MTKEVLTYFWQQIVARIENSGVSKEYVDNTFVPLSEGKGLSTNDFTDEDKSKLDGVASGANNYVLPVGGEAIGGVKNGGDIAIDSNGNMNINNSAVTNAKLAATSVGTSKMIDRSVTRVKLANEALYSPVNSRTSNYTIDASDLGKTVCFNSSSARTITFDDSVALTLPTGSEIAICRWGSGTANLVLSGEFWVAHIGDGWIKRDTDATVTVRIPERFGMIALKRITSASWLITGDVEVVS